MLPKNSFAGGVCVVVIAAIIGFMVGGQLRCAWTLKNQLTHVADAYSEADILRGAEGLVANGFGPTVGLPDVAYGTSFEDVGGKHDPVICASSERCIYLHNPPGATLVVAVLMKLAGQKVMFVFRLVPILLGLFAYVYLAFALVRTQGVVRAAFVFVVFAIVPMSYNMMHGVAYHSYDYHFFLIELAILLFVFDPLFAPPPPRSDVGARASGRDAPLGLGHCAALAVVSALTSCVSYEWIAITAFLAVPVWLTSADWREKSQIRKMIACTLVCGGAFALVQVLHIAQVAAYLGGFGEALRDLAARGKLRTVSGADEAYTAVGLVSLYFYYWFDLVCRVEFLGFSFTGFVATVIAALVTRGPRPLPWRAPGGGRLAWNPPPRYLAALAAAFVLATAWITVMQAHAFVHGQFLPRMYMVVIVFGALLVARSLHAADGEAHVTAPERSPTPEASRPPSPA